MGIQLRLDLHVGRGRWGFRDSHLPQLTFCGSPCKSAGVPAPRTPLSGTSP